MSSFVGRAIKRAVDPGGLVLKADAPDDPNRDAALAASANAEFTATTDAEEKLAKIYGTNLPLLQAGTGLAADDARRREGMINGAAADMRAWRPGTFDAAENAPRDVYVDSSGQAQATQARQAQVMAQQSDLGGVLAAQRGAGPSVAGAQTAMAMDAARRQAGMQAAGVHGGNAALAARGAMMQNAAPNVAVQGAMARGQELNNLRGLASQGEVNAFGNVLGMDKTAQNRQQLNNNVEVANRSTLAQHAGLASDAFGQGVRDYKVGGALQKTADTANLNAYDQKMTDTENAFSNYQDYLQSLYGTGLSTAVNAGKRAAGNLDTILGAARQQDAANVGLVGSLVGGVLGAGGAAASKAATQTNAPGTNTGF